MIIPSHKNSDKPLMFSPITTLHVHGSSNCNNITRLAYRNAQKNTNYHALMVHFSPRSSRHIVAKIRLAAAASSTTGSSSVSNDDDNRGGKSSNSSGSSVITELPEGLEAELMPKHVAVIMDGNRRWAKKKGLPVQLGHRAGAQAMKQLAIKCSKFGIKVATVFSFSTENWSRPQEEVDFLMKLFEEVIQSDFHEISRHDIQISVIGDKSRLPESLQSAIRSTEELSKGKKGHSFLVAMNYSGRYDIAEACKKIAKKVRDGVLEAEDVNESLFEQHLETNGLTEFTNPDLVIRTSGELRISNFMLWQIAHSELVFVNKLFPDIGVEDFVEALKTFQARQRRFGGHKYI